MHVYSASCAEILYFFREIISCFSDNDDREIEEIIPILTHRTGHFEEVL